MGQFWQSAHGIMMMRGLMLDTHKYLGSMAPTGFKWGKIFERPFQAIALAGMFRCRAMGGPLR
jgi:hypothetical protein